MVQLKYACGEMALLPTVPSHLMECFTDYLEKLSVARVEEGGMAVIIIDGADLIKVRTYCLSYLCWFLYGFLMECSLHCNVVYSE